MSRGATPCSRHTANNSRFRSCQESKRRGGRPACAAQCCQARRQVFSGHVPYEQDDNGQWWYVCRNYRTRAEQRQCVTCGSPFYAIASGRSRYCSKRCHLLGPLHPCWRGGRTMQKGYVWVRAGNDEIAGPMASRQGYVAEHRLVVARALGRALLRNEQVHHINGDKTDNRLANLELRTKPHGPGVVLECRACGSRDVQAVPLRTSEPNSAAG
jgi:hypothetical protein